MEEDQDKRFKIFGDEETEEEPAPDETEAEPADTPLEAEPAPPTNSKPLFVAVFAFCVLGALLFFGYYQLNNQISRIESTGFNEIQGMSKEISKRLSAFSDTLDKQQTTIENRLAELGTQVENNAAAVESLQQTVSTTKQTASDNVSEVESRVNRLSERIEKLGSRIGGVSADLSENIDDVQSRVNRLDQSINQTGTQIKTLQSRVDEMGRGFENMRSRVDSLASQIQTLQAEQSEQIDPQEVEKRINAIEQAFNRQISTTEKRLQNRMSKLGDRFSALEAIVKSIKSKQSTGEQAGAEDGQSQAPPPGEIIEQEIQE